MCDGSLPSCWLFFFFLQASGDSDLCPERTRRRDVGLNACGCQKSLDQLVHGQEAGPGAGEVRDQKKQRWGPWTWSSCARSVPKYKAEPDFVTPNFSSCGLLGQGDGAGPHWSLKPGEVNPQPQQRGASLRHHFIPGWRAAPFGRSEPSPSFSSSLCRKRVFHRPKVANLSPSRRLRASESCTPAAFRHLIPNSQLL